MKTKVSPLNPIWLFLIAFATVVAAYGGKMKPLTEASFKGAGSAVELAIGLVGSMALWLGIMRVAEEAGLMQAIARAIRPVMVRLFPTVPPEHPAMSAMIMNLAANALGLGNAATPLGLKAMKELDRLNPNPGTATNAMCLFLAINTASVTLIPLEVIAVRASAGTTQPASIVLTTLIATAIGTTAAVLAAKFAARRSPDPAPVIEPTEPIASATDDAEAIEPAVDTAPPPVLHPPSRVGQLVFGGLVLAFLGAIVQKVIRHGFGFVFSLEGFTTISNWVLPMFISGFLIYGYFRGVRVYEALTEGAKEGFEIAVRVIPFMVAIFVAIGMFRASGALELLTNLLTPVTALIGMPAEALPMALIRPLSGSGAFGFMSEIVKANPNSFLADLVCTMQGASDTTFYTLAVYFGSVAIIRTRYALPVGLFADAVSAIASVLVCRLLLPGAA
ncbi:spore maturation protein [Limnothrix sp. FACHB-881]|uniref:nucleoside recognition domain-containing protein n=1 Tax=Limnothrix sp. FACHB-881 TaxID=2692819 RepID=UPI0016832A6D|nr:nucleoside recognition domain-containing protein [Limnothrix sp. FACHB-881]MBD2635764.1 spore maturation protein [Limnothrix sp. FACHB-881]